MMGRMLHGARRINSSRPTLLGGIFSDRRRFCVYTSRQRGQFSYSLRRAGQSSPMSRLA